MTVDAPAGARLAGDMAVPVPAPVPTPTPDAWRRVDAYLTETLVGHDAALENAVAAQHAAGLPAIEVAPVAGKLLHLLARISGARRVLEIGTLGGVLDDLAGPRHPGSRAGRHDRGRAGQRRRSPARASIAPASATGSRSASDAAPTCCRRWTADRLRSRLHRRRQGVQHDLPRLGRRLGHPGTVVIVDNIGREGEVANPDTTAANVIGTQRGLGCSAATPDSTPPRCRPSTCKGWDGVAIAVVTDAAAEATAR